MSEIDWGKPVECSYEDGGTSYYPVVFHGDNPDGTKYCVVQRPNGHHFSIFCEGRSSHRFRNVRRRVKHEKSLHYLLDAKGRISCYSEEVAKALAAEGEGEYRRVDFEWEVEVDE